MTTNKTIDGVPRELLERIVSHCKFWHDHPYLEAIQGIDKELRALLDAPAGGKDGSEVERLIALCLQKDAAISEMDRIYSALHDAATDCADTLYCQSSQGADALEVLRSLLNSGLPTAQPHRSPVVLMELVENKIYGGMYISKWDNPGALKEGFHRLYAEQPAPVAVVLPDQKAVSALVTKAARQADLINGANYYTAAELAAEAVIDEVTRLNTK